MSLSAETLDAIADRVADRVLARLGSVAAPAPILRRMTVEQFSFVVELVPDVIRRKIRAQIIPAKWVSGPPYFISPAALTLFAVTPEQAAARLSEWAAAQTPLPKPQHSAA